MISNSPQQHVQLRLERRKSFRLGVTLATPARLPLDLTGSQVFLVLQETRYPYSDVLNVLPTDVHDAQSYIQFDLQAAQLDLFPGVYDLAITLVDSNGYSILLVKGSCEILDNADRNAAAHTYVGGVASGLLDAVVGPSGQVVVIAGANVPPGYSFFSDQDRIRLELLEEDVKRLKERL